MDFSCPGPGLGNKRDMVWTRHWDLWHRVFIPLLSWQTFIEGWQCVRHSVADWPVTRVAQGTPGMGIQTREVTLF